MTRSRPLTPDPGPLNKTEYYINPSSTEYRTGDNFRDEDGLTQWHAKLVDELGTLFNQVRSSLDSNFNYGDLNEAQRINSVEAVCDFQENFVPDSVESSIGKYESVSSVDLSPRAIVPFYPKIVDGESLNDNKEIVSHSITYSRLPVKPVIHTTSEFISDSVNRNKIAQAYELLGITEVFVWIEDLDKQSTTVAEYYDVADLIARIAESGIDPHVMHGDFFAHLLYYVGNRGATFGTFYRDSREEKEESGGFGNLQRYYFDPIKEFLSITSAIKISGSKKPKLLDHGMLRNWEELGSEDKGEDFGFLMNHHVATRGKHKRDILNKDLNTLLEELTDGKNEYGDAVESVTSSKSCGHLENWTKALRLYAGSS